MPNIFAQYYEPFIPEKIKILFIAESPPAYNGDEPTKYFYKVDSVGAEPLFSTIMLAVNGNPYHRDPEQKLILLGQFRDDGYFLIDTVEYPINNIPQRDRAPEILRNKDRFTHRINALKKDGRINKDTKAILIKESVYNCYHDYKEIEVLNDRFIRFPYCCNCPDVAEEIRRLL